MLRRRSSKPLKKAKRRDQVSRGYVIEIANEDEIIAYLSILHIGTRDIKTCTFDGKRYLVRRATSKVRIYQTKIDNFGNRLLIKDGAATDRWLKDNGLQYSQLLTVADWLRQHQIQQSARVSVPSQQDQAQEYCIKVIHRTISQYPNLAMKIMRQLETYLTVVIPQHRSQRIPQRMQQTYFRLQATVFGLVLVLPQVLIYSVNYEETNLHILISRLD